MVVVLLAAAATQAQEIPDRKREQSKPVEKPKMFNKKEIADLNLTDEQMTKLKSMKRDMRQQMDELRKNDGLSPKEYHEKIEALRKDHQAKFQSILTPEQQKEMQKYKAARDARGSELKGKRRAKLKEKYNLTDDQMAKLADNHKIMSEKMRAIRENNSLKDDEKKEQIKQLMKERKENLKSILTKEQLEKMKEHRKDHPKKKKSEEI